MSDLGKSVGYTINVIFDNIIPINVDSIRWLNVSLLFLYTTNAIINMNGYQLL